MLVFLMAGLISTPGQLLSLPFDSQFQQVASLSNDHNISFKEDDSFIIEKSKDHLVVYISIILINKMLCGELDLKNTVSDYLLANEYKILDLPISKIVNELQERDQIDSDLFNEYLTVLIKILANLNHQNYHTYIFQLENEFNLIQPKPSI